MAETIFLIVILFGVGYPASWIAHYFSQPPKRKRMKKHTKVLTWATIGVGLNTASLIVINVAGVMNPGNQNLIIICWLVVLMGIFFGTIKALK